MKVRTGGKMGKQREVEIRRRTKEGNDRKNEVERGNKNEKVI